MLEIVIALGLIAALRSKSNFEQVLITIGLSAENKVNAENR